MSQRLVTGEQMKVIDQYTIEEVGIPSMVLMERAALAASEYVLENTSASARILAVCGTGNNGADGIAVGRMLFLKERPVDILLVGDEQTASKETKQQLAIARNIGVNVFMDALNVEWTQYTVLVDALFGIGLNREVKGSYKRLIDQINREKAEVFSVDIASGLSGNTGEVMGAAVQADHTVTFGWKKTGMETEAGKRVSGKVVIADIGYPAFVLERVTHQ
ncbi:NAD(P)H-hydrate epimerase [Atopococcus tabaci]|uniref:NAD(P)H-hydrate epimerase n=1 Tax=Atopococcus tabaci TaxID=269774 RepID=UPI00041F5667|nr:NAD(P)H-hydrate epimerase [Atopococcus tabaci]